MDFSLEILFHISLTKNFTIYIQHNISFSSNKKILCENVFSVSSIQLVTEKMCSWYGPNCYCNIFSSYITKEFQPCRIQIHFFMCYWPVYMQHSHLRSGFNLLISVMTPAWHIRLCVRQRLAGRSKILKQFTSFIRSHKFSFMDMHEKPISFFIDP